MTNPFRVCFLFPGQGSQYTGMGKELYENYNEAKEYMDFACDFLNYDYKKICFEGPDDKLKQTDITQVCVYIIDRMTSKLLASRGIKPVITAGHSLGEYAALSEAGVLTEEDALFLVNKRAQYMHGAAMNNPGAMAAVMKISFEQVEKICAAREALIVSIAGYNSPAQTVISGTVEGVEAVKKDALEAGAKIMDLKVSGAWHSDLMEAAAGKLAGELAKVQLKTPTVKIISNSFGRCVEEKEEIEEALLSQLTSPVRWTETLEALMNENIKYFIECGPGNVLRGLLRRNYRDAVCLFAHDKKAFERTVEKIKGGETNA